MKIYSLPIRLQLSIPLLIPQAVILLKAEFILLVPIGVCTAATAASWKGSTQEHPGPWHQHFSMGNISPSALSDAFPFFPGSIALVAPGHSLMNYVTRILCCFKLGSPELTTEALLLSPWCFVCHFQHVNFSQFLLYAPALYFWCLSTLQSQ